MKLIETTEKLRILGEAAKYDVSCSSSGSERANTPGGIGNGHLSGICHSWAEDGRCVSLLKILFTNYCIYDCAYCVNRRSNDIERASFTPDEVADLTINFYRRNYIEGLFLSSGIVKNPDYTMELLIKTAKKLRTELFFNGYIHLKAIPGASPELIQEAGLYADRLSVNIELPSEAGLKLLTQKTKADILKPMGEIGRGILISTDERKRFKNAPLFAPAGQSTQLIVGATPDSDRQIIKLSESLYNKFGLKRVYYSAFMPVSNDSRLPALPTPPLTREHRLYQADWLMRYYNFHSDEIVTDTHPFLDEDIDPKAGWALRNIHLFPVEINTAQYEILLRIPGVGIISAQKIIKARRVSSLNFEHLKKLGVVLKRAKYFITCRGKMLERSFTEFKMPEIKQAMISAEKPKYEQLRLF